MGIRLASGMYRITSLSSSSYVYRGRHARVWGGVCMVVDLLSCSRARWGVLVE